MKIYVAGHKGLVGSAIVRKIEKSNIHTWVGKERSSLNLLNRKDVFDYIASEKPDAIILAAAKVGGINANSQFPVEFLSENLQIQSNVIDGAHAARTKKFLFLGSSCIYPKFAQQPIKESELLTGALEETNEPYAIAKIAGLKLINAYRNEYGHKWISAMPTNVYGPNDNFDTKSSHVLPALIRKFHDAKIHNLSSVVLWGTGF
jgi:GDP-L-fucose synthase